MSTSPVSKPLSEGSSTINSAMVAIFYLFTFLMGGFFLFVGNKLGIVGDLTAAASYIAVTVLFYAHSKRSWRTAQSKRT